MLNKILNQIKEEIEFSNKKYKTYFNSTQEALGTIREEYKELEQEIFNSKEVWFRDIQEDNKKKMANESIQVAAMAIKLILSLKQYEK